MPSPRLSAIFSPRVTPMGGPRSAIVRCPRAIPVVGASLPSRFPTRFATNVRTCKLDSLGTANVAGVELDFLARHIDGDAVRKVAFSATVSSWSGTLRDDGVSIGKQVPVIPKH